MAFFIEIGNEWTQQLWQILPFLTPSVTFSLCTLSKATRKSLSSKCLSIEVFSAQTSSQSRPVSPEWAVATKVSNESLNDDKKPPSVPFLIHFIMRIPSPRLLLWSWSPVWSSRVQHSRERKSSRFQLSWISKPSSHPSFAKLLPRVSECLFFSGD